MRSRVTLAVAAVIGISAVLTPITLVVGPALRAAALSDAQEITTIAGGAVPGYSGDGGPATSAKLSGPSSVGVDGSGNIADFDYANHRVRLTAGSTGRYFNQSMTAGDIYTVAGNGTLGYSGDGGPATSAELSFGSVSVDFSGNLIISDSSNNRVRVVAASTGMFYGQSMVVGDIYTTAGNGSSGYSGDGGSALSAKMTSPEETTIDGWGNLAINDAGNGVVRLLAVASGTFYGHSMTAGDIYTVAGNGYGGYSGDGGPALSAEFFSISDVVSDLSGNLLIADAGNGRVRAVAATTGTFYGQSMTAGYVYSIAGNGDSGYAGDGGPATSAVFSVWSPGALAVDRSGNVIISDSSNNRVRAVAASTGTFYGQSMTVGYIYTVAGDGISGLSGDGGPATSASVSPGGVTVDGSGNLIIGGGSEVRVVWSGLTPVGTITGVSPLTALARATSVGSGRAAVHDPSCTHGAYPVNCASGDFWHSFVDASVAGRGPGLGLNRTYNSLNAATTGMFGYGWTSSYGISLVVNGDSSITIIEADGSQVTATPNGGGGFTLPSWADSSLSLSSGNYTFVQHQTQTYVFDSSGQLTSISNPNNYATTLSYTSGKLTTVTDSASRTLTIAYGINGLVSTVTDPLSRVTTYGYDGSGNLTSVTDPASRVTSFTYDSNHLLLTMTLPNGQSGGPDAGDKVTNTYDGQGRVLTQVDPAGLETTYSYVGDNFSSTGGSTTITDPHGNIEVEDYINGTLVSLTKGYGTSVAATTTYAYDSSTLGQSSVTDPNGHTTTNTYDLSGNELTSTDALGKTTVYTYNSLNEPLTVTDPMGIETTYTYDSGGNVLTKVVTGDGGSPPTQTTSYTYGDGHPGDLTEVTDPDGHVTTYSYDSHGDRTSSSVFVTGAQTSATSSVDRFSYGSISAVGSLASSGGVGDTTLSVSPATVGDAFVASVRTASSSITVSSISGGGATWSKLQGATDSKQGRDVELWLGVISATGSSTITVTYSSSVSGTSTEILAQEYTNGTGSGTTWTKDTASSSDNSTSSTTVTFPSLTPAGSNELYVGFAGLAHTGSAGSTSGFTYDISPTYTNPYIYNTNVSSNVSPTATQSPTGQSLAVGVLLIAKAAPSTVATVSGLSSSTGPVSGGTFVVITGSNLSMTTAVHFGSTSVGFGVIGATSVFVFTPSGTTGTVDVTVTTAGTANTTNTVYDSDGELLCTSSPTASNSGVTCPAPGGGRVADTTTNVYNADGQVTSATDPNGNATTTTYDADGNTTQVTDALSNVTKTTYDADDRTTAVTNGYGSGSATTTSSTFDIAPGSCPSAPTGTTYCSQSTDGLSNVTTSYFNALDQMIEQAPPNTTAQSVATYAYDGVGNVLTKTDGSGTVTYTVDVDNRPSTVTYSATPSGMAQPHAVTYSYDYDGNRTQMTDGTGTTTYGYDPFERLNEVTNGASQVITYGYDADSNVTCLSYPNSGSTTCLNASSGTGLVAYTYNEASQATQLSDWLGNSTTFTYDADGNLVNTTMPSGTTTSTSNTYDNANGLTDTSVQTGSTVTDMSRLTRNADDNIASTTPASGGGTAYGYDSLNRVTAGTTAGYTYNADSQVASTTPTGGSATNFSYNADSQLCWTGSTSAACGSPPSGATAYSYNTAGERASSTPSGGTPTTDGWDQAGNLTCETAPNSSSYSCASPNAGSTTTFAYNGDGLRMSEVPAGGSTQQFAWDVGSSTPNLLQDGTNYYLYGPNVASAPIEQITVSGSTPTWLISDTTGVRQQISSTGSTIGSMSYNSFGNRCGGCSISTPFGFAGAYSDPTGLVYLIHRYYDPTTGQFLSVDPLVDQSGQPYAYTSNDPVNLRDPSGLCNSNPFSGSFWTGGNCIAGAVGGPTGSPGESLTGVVKSIGLLAAGDVVIVGGGYIAGVGGVAFASSVEGGTAAVAADTSFWGLTWASDVGVTGLTFASSLLIPPGLAFAGLVWLGGAISAGSERQRTCSKS